ncbi:hypothetical protein PENSPDRAFT_689115 [Peniophora sp. CONT]|nr:hypothetical protein PENSPDRAFT_689115 [Peniophora sp. CONT]
MSYPVRLCEYIDDYTAFSKILCERHSKNNALRQALTQSLRCYWYDKLEELRTTKPLDHAVLRRYLSVEFSWLEFGKALGLSEEVENAEREREKKEAARLCAWRECQYHKVKPPSPPNVCKGCGEARYCGRECQIKDWKAGHKRVCKRIKDESHTSKV